MKKYTKVRVTLRFLDHELYHSDKVYLAHKGEVADYLKASPIEKCSWLRFQNGKQGLLYNVNFERYVVSTNEEALAYLEREENDTH